MQAAHCPAHRSTDWACVACGVKYIRSFNGDRETQIRLLENRMKPEIREAIRKELNKK